MENIYLIGGSGFIGKNLVNLFRQNYEVHVIDKFIDEKFFSERPEVKTLNFAWCIEQIIKNHNKAVGEIINVGSGESISLKSIIEICKNHIGSSSEIKYGALPYRENEVMDLRCDEGKLSKTINHEIKFNINNRLKEYINKL